LALELESEPDADSEIAGDPIGVAPSSDWGSDSGITYRARFYVVRGVVGEVLVGVETYSTSVSSSISRKKCATDLDLDLPFAT